MDVYRYNELQYRWVALDTWTWTASFPTPAAVSAAVPLQLRLETIDGPANVSLNGVHLGSFTNSHRPATFSVTGLLRRGGANNTLTVAIGSAPTTATAAAGAYPYAVPALQQKGGLPNYNFIRKAASDFGWDWGPAFAPACVLGEVSLTALDGPQLVDAVIAQRELGNGSIALDVTAFFSVPETTDTALGSLALGLGEDLEGATSLWAASAEVELSCRSLLEGTDNETTEASVGAESCAAIAISGPSDCAAHATLIVDAPFDRWWPWELGTPHLYNLSIRYTPEGNGTETTVTKRIGLRSVELVTDSLGSAGETFYFRINGVPMFMRGANVIPSDIMESSVGPENLTALVQDARKANMNMLRVWGGGRYAQESLYSSADELGILVWQEFMAACSPYPRDQAFLKEVVLEARHQFTRLSGHPSIVIWGGNNEVEASLGWSITTLLAPQKFASDYTTLFVETLRPTLLELDAGLVFLDTSPSNGLESTNPYVKRWGDVSDPSRGDIHFYDYTSDAFDPGTYPPARFVSEYGFMSWPSFSVYQTVTTLGDWDLQSPMTNFRLRRTNGDTEVQNQISRHFVADADSPPAITAFDGPPDQVTIGGPSIIVSTPGSQDDNSTDALQFEAFVHLSQVQQALAYETAAGVWRRGKTNETAQTMGMLYWQLNDVWQGPSWSSINYGGQWKLLHHAAKRFFAPVFLSAHRIGDDILATIVNDLPLDVSGTLDVDVILYAATSADLGVIPIVQSAAQSVPALGTATGWSITTKQLSHKVLVSAAPNQLSYDSDYFLRLRFCPTASRTVTGLPNPLRSGQQQVVAASVGSPAAEHDELCEGDECDVPEEELSALAECSETYYFPVDFNHARLWGTVPTLTVKASNGANDSDLVFQVESSAVALFVSIEPPQGVSGNFNVSGMIVLPWEPQTVVFTPTQGESTATVDAGSLSASDMESTISLRSLQQSMRDYNTSSSASGTVAGTSAASSQTLGLGTLFCLLVAIVYLEFVH